VEVLKYLVSQGADVNVKSLIFDKTPLDIAKGREKRRFLRECMQNK
jgi:ankyrin repeat protein